MYRKTALPIWQSVKKLENEIDLLEEKLESTIEEQELVTITDAQRIRNEKNRIKSRLRKAENSLEKTEKSIKDRRKTEKKRYEFLKAELHENWHRYVDDLAYYSVSKFVSSGVRKSARSICRKYGIDYEGWAEKQVKNRKLLSGDIITR
jgi:regulator of replication initiation timing